MQLRLADNHKRGGRYIEDHSTTPQPNTMTSSVLSEDFVVE